MNKKTFSIAEVTIALLIGSLILGMTAPMISKQIKNNNSSDAQISILLRRIENLERNNTTPIPAGSIIFFEGNGSIILTVLIQSAYFLQTQQMMKQDQKL